MLNEKIHGKAARAAISAALTGAMVFGGVMAPVATALAEGSTPLNVASDGKVDEELEATIKSSSADEIAKQKVFQLFKADIAIQNNTFIPTASTIGWSNVGISKTVVDILEETDNATGKPATGATQTYAAWRAKEGYDDVDKYDARAAEGYIAAMIDASTGASKTAFDKATLSSTFANIFASKVAAALDTSSVKLDLTVSGTNGTFTGAEGYYLITDGTATSAPIYLPVAGGNGAGYTREATLKSVPASITKEVKSNAGIAGESGAEKPEYVKIVDLALDDEATFKLHITPASNATYYHVNDVLPGGMSFVYDKNVSDGITFEKSEDDSSDLKVANAKVTNGTLSFDINGVTDGTKAFDVIYKTKVNSGATLGDNLNTNKVTLDFGTSDTDFNTTTPAEASVASYELDLIETDGEAKAVQDAHFTIKDKDGHYLNKETGLFERVDGDVQDNPAFADYYFVTNEEGRISAPRLDADTYTINEISANDDRAIVVEIKAELDETAGTITKLEGVKATENVRTISAIENDKAAGVVTVRVGKLPAEITLPITGMTPSQLGTVMGALLVAAGGVAIAARRRKGSEQA